MRDGDVAALDVRAGCDDARAQQTPARDVVTPRRHRTPVARHVANARHAVQDVQRQQLATAFDRDVDVHVPETGDEILPATIDHARTGRNACRPGGCYRLD